MSKFTHEIMLKNEILAKINIEDGSFLQISDFLPFDLKCKSMPVTITDRVQNISGFMDWCAKRVLMMNQKHAKQICNALALSQENSTENKAGIALAYHCCTLTDGFWVRESDSNLSYEDIFLFRNSSRNILTPVSLAGKSESLFQKQLKNWSDIGTDGTLAKSWIREADGYYLCKTGDNISGELLASKILSILKANHVSYSNDNWIYETGETISVTKCKCFTNERIGFIPYKTYCQKFGKDALNFIKENFLSEYANMAVATYLLGNEDLHDKNWGLLFDNDTKKILGFAPLFDFDGCFLSYNTSKNLHFLPECKYINENGEEFLAPEFNMDICYQAVGLTLEEAALMYAPDCTYDFSLLDSQQVPDVYREEFSQRVTKVEQARNAQKQQNESNYEYEE